MIIQQKINDEQLRKWFADRPALKLTILEQEAKLPTRTLTQFVRGRSLPVKHIEPLLNVLTKYGYNYEGFKIKLQVSKDILNSLNM